MCVVKEKSTTLVNNGRRLYSVGATAIRIDSSGSHRQRLDSNPKSKGKNKNL
jgi:hypothetical protein